MSLTDLWALSPVEEALTAAQNKLAGYQDTLQKAYGDILRLKVYSVVAVGYERLIWQEL